MAKAKIDVIINGITYKGIQVYDYNGKYTIDTSGISTIIRQFIKNNYGDIKNWVRSRSFAGGSSVDVYLWAVPNEWYKNVEEFADSFGMFNTYDGGDGYWRGRRVNATTKDGVSVDNASPYMHVSNTPPWDAKERDMTPPEYTEKKKTPEKKEYKGGFKSKFNKESKTAGFDHIYTCGNGWKIFLKNEYPKYTYRVVKDYNVKPVDKEQFYALKGDMLEGGFEWSVKAQCFERNTIGLKLDRDFFEQIVCNILSKYFPKIGEFESQIEEPESSTEGSVPSEVNLDQLISDMQVLVDLEMDEVNKLSLLQYINDLQTLKMLEN